MSEPVTFKDHFSTQAEAYSLYRPEYPTELYDWLASLCPETKLAWDCATGNGQAAVALTQQFSYVIGTDASESQIYQAMVYPRVEYEVGLAHESPHADHSVDLVTVAQALHWFDLPRFSAEAERVLKPGGILAVWSYNLLTICPDIDEQIRLCHLSHLAV